MGKSACMNKTGACNTKNNKRIKLTSPNSYKAGVTAESCISSGTSKVEKQEKGEKED